MSDISNWNLYYNKEGDEMVRANLVYTPYVSPDKTTFCMSFQRDPAYHIYDYENVNWAEQDLIERFNKELEFHERASKVMPTLSIKDVEFDKRRIFIEWHGDDFYMQGLENSYDSVLPDWKAQWIDLVKKMWAQDIMKFSLHPNSWVAKDGVLIPFNWFFCYDKQESNITIRNVLKQISFERQEKLAVVLKAAGMDLDTPYDVKTLQTVAFNSFRSNYPADLIDKIIQEQHDIL